MKQDNNEFFQDIKNTKILPLNNDYIVLIVRNPRYPSQLVAETKEYSSKNLEHYGDQTLLNRLINGNQTIAERNEKGIETGQMKPNPYYNAEQFAKDRLALALLRAAQMEIIMDEKRLRDFPLGTMPLLEERLAGFETKDLFMEKFKEGYKNPTVDSSRYFKKEGPK